MKDTLAGRIESLKAGKITKSQRKILEYFETADHKHIIYMSITQLAEEVGVAEATVLRFCRSLGFNGYQEFRHSRGKIPLRFFNAENSIHMRSYLRDNI